MNDFKKNDALLQQNCYLLNSFSSKTRKYEVSKGSHFKTALSFAIIDSIEATALKFINNPKMLKNNKSVFEWKKLNQLELSLKYN